MQAADFRRVGNSTKKCDQNLYLMPQKAFFVIKIAQKQTRLLISVRLLHLQFVSTQIKGNIMFPAHDA